MEIPQIITIVWIALEIGASVAKHGEIKTGIYNFWDNFIYLSVLVWLLFWGGFFK